MIANPDFRTAKIMHCIFFDGHGPVPKGRTVIGNLYTNNWLLEVDHLTRRRPKTGAKGLRLLYDKARPHKTKQVQEKIESVGMVELEHLPYSTDLAPCEFYLIPKLKEYLILIAMQLSVRRYLAI